MSRGAAKKYQRIGLRLLASGLVVVLLLLSVLSASDFLHHLFHHNERQGTSACAACLLVKGHLESPDVPAAVLIFVPQRVSLTATTITRPPSHPFLSTPSRAPPATTHFSSVAV
jgi:hypothetical protein